MSFLLTIFEKQNKIIMEKLTIKELKQRKELFLDLFADGKSVIANEFNISLEQLKNKHFVYAYYSCGDYSGDAYLLFIENDKLYEVDAGHCSCYGLEEQFNPEEVPIEVLYYRIENNKWNSHHLQVALALPIDRKEVEGE